MATAACHIACRPCSATKRQRSWLVRQVPGRLPPRRLGKLPKALAIASKLDVILAEQGFIELPISFEDGQRAGWLAGDHRDPFDCMLAAQALARDLPIMTRDAALKALGMRVVW